MGQPHVGYPSSTPRPAGALCLGLIEPGITPGTRPIAGSRSRFPLRRRPRGGRPCRTHRPPRRAPAARADRPDRRRPGQPRRRRRPTIGAVASWVDAMAAAWKRAGGSGVPRLLAGQMARALDTLIRAVAARDPARPRQAALQVSRPPSTSSSATVRRRSRPGPHGPVGPAAAGRRRRQGPRSDRRRRGHPPDPLGPRRPHHPQHRSHAAERVSAALRSLGEAANKDRSKAAAARVPALRAALPT
jgi:hypothetical protein